MNQAGTPTDRYEPESLYSGIAAILFTTATVGAWGLVEQRTAHPQSAPVRLAESLLAVLGMLLAAGAALGFFFGFLGPAPIL